MGLLSFVGDVVGGLFGADEPERPDFSGQQRAADEAIALQRQMYEEGVERGAPWLDVGQAGISRLGEMLGVAGDPAAAGYGSLSGVDMTDWQTDPGYQFRMDEGLKALERGAASRGNLYAPSTARALMQYGQNLGAQEYGNIYNRRMGEQSNLYNRLAGISGAGQTQAAQQSAAGQTMADVIGSTNLGLQQAMTAADLGAQSGRQSQFSSTLGSLATAAPTLAKGAGALVKGVGSLAGMLGLSDKNSKENIKEVGTKNGQKIYEFNYKGGDKKYRGVIAQDLLDTMPEAVKDIDGVLYVDYEKLGFPMEEVS